MIKQLIRMPGDFFENNVGNAMTMGIGFVLSSVCIAVVFGLYQL